MNNCSFWEKKKKDKTTGEETEVWDYDRNAITKAVKSFIEDYNSVVEKAGYSNTKNVLRNAAQMTGMTEANSHLLAKIGITVGKGNKLELDEDSFKKADINTLKTVFNGYSSFAGKIAQKASNISSAANRAKATYTSAGTYSNVLSSLLSGKLDQDVTYDLYAFASGGSRNPDVIAMLNARNKDSIKRMSAYWAKLL